MKRSLKNLIGYSIEALDGPKGKVKDFLFDEDTWVIRYLEVDFGSFFKSKRVLIPSVFLKKPIWEMKHFPIELTKDEIERCPGIDEKIPVSREYELELSKHYNYSQYWSSPYIPPAGALYFPTRPLKVPTKIIDEKNMDTSLRSFNEVKGYHINAIDGKLGHVEDIIVDDSDWQIVYLIVDTSNWLPWSKKVLLAITWMEEISYLNSEVSISLHTDTIKNAPEYNAEHPVGIDYEKELFNYYKIKE
jgi:sporulation protein YlmC with PRC-barrel domain